MGKLIPIDETKEYRQIVKAILPAVPLTIRFEYVDRDGNITDRHVEPYEIKGDRLWAHCLEHGEIRQFKIESMSNVIHDEKFEPRHAVKVPVS